MEWNGSLVETIKELISELRAEYGITNEIIRDDVFNILQGLPNCTVVYYPIESEAVESGCDGCHVERTIKGVKEQMVFINTANTRERQAFSAAHELGHIWKVDARLRERMPEVTIDIEAVIDRFAAELLMPDTIFRTITNKKIQEYVDENQCIQGDDMIRIIVFLMDYFFTPYTATVRRLKEIDLISSDSQRLLLQYKGSELVQNIIVGEQYTRLGIKTNNKSVANLAENLALIEQKQSFSENKLNAIRKKFDLVSMQNQSGEKVETVIKIANI